MLCFIHIFQANQHIHKLANSFGENVKIYSFSHFEIYNSLQLIWANIPFCNTEPLLFSETVYPWSNVFPPLPLLV